MLGTVLHHKELSSQDANHTPLLKNTCVQSVKMSHHPCHSGWLTCPVFFFFFKFICLGETRRERHRHKQREKQAPCREPDVGLDPRT